jgi:anti-sigma B factor antagonist
VKINRNPQERAMVLQLSGDIMGGPDYETFTGEIKKLVDEGHVDIVLDLGKVRYINSTGLGILVSGLTSLKKNMGQMKICNLSDRIDRLFSVTSLTTVFPTFDSLDEAVASFYGVSPREDLPGAAPLPSRGAAPRLVVTPGPP